MCSAGGGERRATLGCCVAWARGLGPVLQAICTSCQARSSCNWLAASPPCMQPAGHSTQFHPKAFPAPVHCHADQGAVPSSPVPPPNEGKRSPAAAPGRGLGGPLGAPLGQQPGGTSSSGGSRGRGGSGGAVWLDRRQRHHGRRLADRPLPRAGRGRHPPARSCTGALRAAPGPAGPRAAGGRGAALARLQSHANRPGGSHQPTAGMSTETTPPPSHHVAAVH